LSIFSRLMIGFLALLALAMGVGIFALVQLDMVKNVTHSILLDNYLIDLQKDLSDTLLSETRYEKKFVIMHDSSLREGFLASKSSFERHLAEAGMLPNSSEVKDILARVKDLHNNYQFLCAAETGYLKTGQGYSKQWYDETKERVVNAALEELTKLRSLSEDGILRKIRNLGDAGTQAITVAMSLAAASLALGVFLSVMITRSITLPLAKMQDKTREIARGVFEANLNLPSPPEIGELARAFNFMCRKLKEVDTMKSDFFSLMSHELRTPLTSIKEGTNLFLEGLGGAITEKQGRILTIIAEESNRLIELVNSLLDLSKLEAGMVTFHRVRTNLSPLIMTAVREIVPLAEAKNIKIDNHIGDLPQVSVDTERILQVLRNLIGNALKYTPRGGSVRIAARHTEEGAAVSIADSGPGIPEEQRAVIFDKFRRAAQAGSRKIEGTGLGLAIVKHIIDAHGGKLWVESEAGQGSTFTFVLPA
jgi:two-component system sensor histidine kinase GlrK